LIPAPHLIEAFKTYAQAFGYDRNLEDEEMRKHFGNEKEYRAWLPDSIHGLLEGDFMFSCKVIVCDESFGTEGREVDANYADEDGYQYGLVQHRWSEAKKWADLGADTERTLIFWKGKKPLIDPKALRMEYLKGLEVRIVRKSYGEDAFGVIWQPTDNVSG
jgi:hypothetical protein